MIEELKKLTKEEVRSFRKFAISPYFNSNKQLIRLSLYLEDKYPYKGENDLNKFEVYNAIYPGKEYNDTKSRKLISDFTNLFERFLTVGEIEKDTARNRIRLLGILRKKGFDKRFKIIFKKIKDDQNKIKSRDNVFYENQVELDTEYFYFNYNRFKYEYAECLDKKALNIDLEFLFHKLHCFHEMIYNEYLNNKTFSYNKTFHDESLQYIKTNEKLISTKHPNLYIIYKVILLWESDSRDILFDLLDYIDKNKKVFTNEHMSLYYYYCLTYISHRINKGEVEYREIALNIFKKMMKKDLFLIDNFITHSDFNSVVNIVLPLNESDWVMSFIQKYKDKIEPAFAKYAYNLALAKILFQKKEFDKVFPYLNEVEYKDPVYYMNSKFMLARLYFETKNADSLNYVINNLSQYSRQKKVLTDEQNIIVKTFVNYMRELLKLYEADKTIRNKNLIVLKRKLENEKNYVSKKEWFYEKIQEISKK